MKFRDWNDKEHELPNERTFSWRPSAYALVLKDDEILFIKSRFHGKWELPGGGIDLGESLEEGVIREVFEETGYKIKLKENALFYVDNTFFYALSVDKYYQTIRLFYEAEILEKGRSGPINDDNEVLDIKQIKIKDLPKYEFNSLTSNALIARLKK